MAIKSILVAYSGDAGGSGGLKLALQMARKYDAHLTGVVSHGPTYLERDYSRYMNAEVLEIIRSRDAAEVADIRARFEARMAAEGAGRKADFLDLNARRGFTLADCARTYDILVMGRRAMEPGREHFGERPEDVALRCGRPVILVPHNYSRDSINEHAVVAWDGKRAAARALGDAMHILETKSKVTVLTVDGGEAGAASGGEIMRLLELHGIAAELLERSSGRGKVGATILDACREVDAGLLVMGAYEHSRALEEFFGGVTRDVMEDAPLPVLMSH
jgi:nucleotide-binding universal stress UspA family protein